MTHEELNALCAEKVGGWTHNTAHSIVGGEIFGDTWRSPEGLTSRPPSYCTDPAAVLALLEKCDWEAGSLTLSKGCYCEINFPEGSVYETAPTFAEAGVRALLAAHGCEVGE